MNSFKSQRALVHYILSNANKFDWSLQGMGMLRLHIGSDCRIHVWHPDYAYSDVSMIHDHLQWGLTSTIMSGNLINIRYSVIEPSLTPTHMYATIKAGYGSFFRHEPRPVKLYEEVIEHYKAGDIYSQRPAEVHETRASAGTVTLMQKHPTIDSESARVFWSIGEVWGTAEPKPADKADVEAIVSRALAIWN